MSGWGHSSHGVNKSHPRMLPRAAQRWLKKPWGWLNLKGFRRRGPLEEEKRERL